METCWNCLPFLLLPPPFLLLPFLLRRRPPPLFLPCLCRCCVTGATGAGTNDETELELKKAS